ncbi:DNA N-6-adenine-methyltransferase [Nocardia sp. NPDC003963]
MTGYGIGGHASTRAGSHVWLTPPGLLASLGDFDLDPAASPDPRPWPTAATHICPPEDGLTARWHGRVFCNPPYGRHIGRWLSKLVEHGTGTALTFARTDTTWFHSYVWEAATAVLFLRGRLHFYRPDGSRADANCGGPSCLIAYGDHDAAALHRAPMPGRLVHPGAATGDSTHIRPVAGPSRAAARGVAPGQYMFEFGRQR